MYSIAEKSAVVNTAEQKTEKWSEKKRVSCMVAKKMCDAGFLERGKRMQFCGHFLGLSVCPECGRSEISSATLCRDRLCPTCQWRLSLRRFAEMCATISFMNDIEDYTAGFLTLTVKNCRPDNLRYTLQTMAKDWNRLLSQRWMKEMLAGSARSVEITYNRKTNTFHPHFHIITFTNPEYSEREVREKFHNGWNKACRLDYEPITDYRLIKPDKKGSGAIDDERLTSAILETYKYSTKSDDLMEMPIDIFRQFVTGIQGIRFASFSGIVKEARKNLGFKDAEEPEDEPKIEVCHCGAGMVDKILQWSFSQQQYIEVSQLMTQKGVI